MFSISVEGGYIHSFEDGTPTNDPIRLTDRFFLGSPQIRGFDIRGVGPRIQRIPYEFDIDANGNPTNIRLSTDRNQILDDAIGGRAYYLGRAELEIPLGSGARELGLRPSVFVDVGALWGVRRPEIARHSPWRPAAAAADARRSGAASMQQRRGTPVVTPLPGDQAGCPAGTVLVSTQITDPFREVFLGDSPRPRLSIGFGVNWNSPFGPFRIDIAKALISAEGDDTKLFTFNVGTAF